MIFGVVIVILKQLTYIKTRSHGQCQHDCFEIRQDCEIIYCCWHTYQEILQTILTPFMIPQLCVLHSSIQYGTVENIMEMEIVFPAYQGTTRLAVAFNKIVTGFPILFWGNTNPADIWKIYNDGLSKYSSWEHKNFINWKTKARLKVQSSPSH